MLSQICCLFAAKPAANSRDFQEIYVKAAKCNLSNKFAYQNYSCFAKSYSRTFSTINIIATTRKPLNNIFVCKYNSICNAKRQTICSLGFWWCFNLSMDWYFGTSFALRNLTFVNWIGKLPPTLTRRTKSSSCLSSIWRTASPACFTCVLTRLSIYTFCIFSCLLKF